MRYLVLGGGAQGSAAAYDLLRDPEVEGVRIADRRTDAVPPFLQSFLGDRLEVRAVDAADDGQVRKAMEGCDGVLCALPYHWNDTMARLAVEVGVHFADLGGNTEIVDRQRTLDQQAREKGVSVVPDCGLAPGLVNILAQAGIDRLDQPETVQMWVGGLPQNPLPPLNYQLVYSLEGVLDYYTTPGLILQEGKLTEVEALSGLEEVDFPEPLGTLEAFYTAGGASTLPHRYRGTLRSLEYRTLRYPGHAVLMRAFRDLGLFSETPVRIDGSEISPRKVFIEVASPALHAGDGRDVVVLRVEVRGRSGDRASGVRYDLIDYFDESIGMTAMTRVTGFSLALVARMQTREGGVKPGVHTPDEALDPEAFVRELADQGIHVRSQEL